MGEIGEARSLSLGDGGSASSAGTPGELAAAEALASHAVFEFISRSRAERRAGSRRELLPKEFK